MRYENDYDICAWVSSKSNYWKVQKNRLKVDLVLGTQPAINYITII